MAEEDIIYGKNRHLFGGIEPSNIQKIKIDRFEDSPYIQLRITPPDDTIIDGQVLCSVKGFVVRRKTGSYPVDEFDGVLVEDLESITGRQTLVLDTVDDLNETYYYAIFPYSTQGVYNRNKANRTISYPVSEGDYVFGYDLDTNDPDPSTRVIYPNDVDNENYRPLRLGPDGTGCTPDYLNQLAPEYGSDIGDATGWFAVRAGEKFMPRPCMLSYDYDWSSGKSYYLAVSDYTRKYGSTDDSDIGNASYEGNAMMQWPKIYTYREEIDGIYKFRCSNKPHGSGWDCWCNYSTAHDETEHFYTSIYHAMIDGTGLPRSLSKEAAVSNPGYTLETAINAITGHDVNSYWNRSYVFWNIECLADRLLIQDLLVMMAGTTNTNSVYGFGNATSGSTSGPGSVNSNKGGLFYTQSITASTSGGHRLFGMENLWGNVGRMCGGWIIDEGVQKIKITTYQRDGSTAEGYNHTGSGYITLEGADIEPAYDQYRFDGYITDMKTTPFGRIPLGKTTKTNTGTFGSDGSGSTTTYESDMFCAYSYGIWCGYFGGFSVSNSDYKQNFYGAFYSDPILVTDKKSTLSFGLSCKPVEEA